MTEKLAALQPPIVPADTIIPAMYPVLYSPATLSPEKLASLANGSDEYVHRMVVCTEDAINEADVPAALKNIRRLFALIDYQTPVEIFIRVRNLTVLHQLLDMPGVENVTGFVIPKADPQSFARYVEAVTASGHSFLLMPILEHHHMTDREFRHDLLETFIAYESMIDCLRIGANDLLGYQGLRRPSAEFTLYDTVVGGLIKDIVNEFRGGRGFIVTAPVFELIDPRYDELLTREVTLNIVSGLYGQTVIHRRHLPLIARSYQVTRSDYDSALNILTPGAAVMKYDGRMNEKTTHFAWATTIMARAEMFGVTSAKPAPSSL